MRSQTLLHFSILIVYNQINNKLKKPLTNVILPTWAALCERENNGNGANINSKAKQGDNQTT